MRKERQSYSWRGDVNGARVTSPKQVVTVCLHVKLQDERGCQEEQGPVISPGTGVLPETTAQAAEVCPEVRVHSHGSRTLGVRPVCSSQRAFLSSGFCSAVRVVSMAPDQRQR